MIQGSHLKPHIAVLVPALLESLSSLEPQQLNMISLQLGGDSETQEMLDTLRVAATKSSPMMETANLCIPYVDADVLTELVPRLVDLLRTGVGLGTKVAAAQFVVSLAHHCRDDLTPHTGKLMGALLSGLGDRSASVRKSYGHSIGRLVKYAKDSSVTKLIERLKKLYFTKEDSSVQSAVAYTVNAMMIHSLDASMSAGSEIAPLIFLAMHATPSEEDPSSKAIVKLWEESWQELVPNSITGVKLYLAELVDVIKTSLSAQSWSVKKQAGTALASLADKIGPNLDAAHLTVILQSLLDGLQGRVWEGKMSLLRAMKSVCKSCSAAVLAGHQPSPDEIVKALLVQCSKRDLHYKAVAIEVTGQVAAALDMDCFSELCDIVIAVLRPSAEEERGEDETEREEARVRRVTMAELQVKSIEALGEAWPSSELSQGRVFSRLMTLLSEVLHNNTRKMQVAVLTTLTGVFTRFKIKLPEEDLSVCSGLVPGLTQCLGNRSYSSVRKSAVEATDQLVQLLLKLGSLTGREPNLLADIRAALQEVTDDQLRELVQKKTLMQLLCPK